MPSTQQASIRTTARCVPAPYEQFFKTPLPAILGLELAGTVDALGEGVTDVAIGDRVFGWAKQPAGSYAELALSETYGRLPDSLDFVRAVTLPVAAETSLRALAPAQPAAGRDACSFTGPADPSVHWPPSSPSAPASP